MTTRKLHGAALAAHNKKKRRKGHGKRKSAKSHPHKGGRSTDARLSRLEHFMGRQKKLNTVFRDSIRHVYSHTGLSVPSGIRKLPKGR